MPTPHRAVGGRFVSARAHGLRGQSSSFARADGEVASLARTPTPRTLCEGWTGVIVGVMVQLIMTALPQMRHFFPIFFFSFC